MNKSASAGPYAQQNANAAQTALNNQQGVDTSLLGSVSNQLQQANGQYQAPASNVSQGYTQTTQGLGSNLSGILNQLMAAGMDPSTLSSLTGIDANHLTQMYTQYQSNPQNTNLAQANGGLSSYYQNQMQNGLDPAIATNAQSQLQQGYNSSLATAQQNAKPGQNLNALTQDTTNSYLQARANLAGSLAGQDQTARSAGAAGVASTAQNLDTQTSSMLGNAATAGSQYNQQALSNLGTANTAGNTALSNAGSYVGQGAQIQQNANNTLGGLSSGFGTQANQFLNTANSTASGGSSSLAGLGSLLGAFF